MSEAVAVGQLCVRRLGPADAADYRTVELEGLASHPSAFSADLTDEAATPAAAIATRLRDEVVFGGFVDGELGAIATYHRSPLRKRSHVGMVSGMYARREYQGTGLARAVLAGVIEHAAAEVDQLELYVAIGNERARRFYDGFGFRPYGVMPRALRVDGTDYDADMLVLTFR